MQTQTLVGLFLAFATVINVFLLGIIVLKQRKFDRQTNCGQFVAAINAIDDAQTPEEARQILVASCEHFRRAQMMWIDESKEAHDSGNLPRFYDADKLSAAWGEVYVRSCAFYRRWDIRK